MAPPHPEGVEGCPDRKGCHHTTPGADASLPFRGKERLQCQGQELLKVARLLKDSAVVLWLHLMLDIITALSMVSTTAQQQDSTLADIWDALDSAKRCLRKYITTDGPYLRKASSSETENVRESIANRRTTVLNSLIACTTERFSGDLHLFQASRILALNKWSADIDFGDDNMPVLVETCGEALKACCPTVDLMAIEPEWMLLKTAVQNRSRQKEAPPLTWPMLQEMEGKRCSNLFTLVNYLLSLPGSSEDAERGFSRMKMVKNDWRSRLGDQNLSDLLLILLEVEPVKSFDPHAAIQLWYAEGTRAKRPFYKDEINARSQPPRLCWRPQVC
ncbi:zinc finger protein 862-like isoform X2 [Mizuhopecten yessoensis]|uniref:zinc finger protein 862-like isoform X2 n=1 Tax=Mizuhopecten yessoensis TaxID=6573 RepID=UPI000B45ECF5|nr:zinc finger protein 862-like isoform X2 [Mizuhopecten yessoensis]